MAAYKLEDNIREKLEERELKPSDNAWDKLELLLDEQQPKKKSFVWFYIAASIIGLVFLSSIFIDRNPIFQENQFVEVDNMENSVETQTKLTEVIDKEKTAEKLQTKPKEKTRKALKPSFSKKPTINKRVEATQLATKVSIQEKDSSIETENQNISEEEYLINNKVEEVVAQIQNLESNSQEVTVEEVELLLENARREIQTQRILESPKVDAMALLQDVEWELEKSFRDKVFDALGEGFQKIRTAYSERNN